MSGRSGFRMVLPKDWHGIPLDGVADRSKLDRFVRQMAGSAPEAAHLREQVALLLQHVVARARSEGALHIAVYYQVLGNSVVGASLVVNASVVPTQFRTEPGVDLDAMAAELAGSSGEDVDAGVVTVNGGPAIRLRRRVKATIEDVSATAESLQYFVPSPEGRQMIVLNFSTPSVPVADALVDLFDAMATTFDWEDDPR